MNKFNFVKDGTMTRLPPGFRFQPTDEELVFQYLKCKVLLWSLPASIIPEINVCKYDPWDLPGDWEQERYFFSSKETKYPNGNRINRSTASGYWKATGVDKQIVSSTKSNQVVGMKKTLVFYRGKPPHGSRTDWIMHEYRLVSLGTNFNLLTQPKNTSIHESSNQLEKWVVCRIFLKKRSTTTSVNNENEILINRNCNKVNNNEPRFYDFMTRDINVNNLLDTVSCSSSSSSSSSITHEVSSNGEDREESSSRNLF